MRMIKLQGKATLNNRVACFLSFVNFAPLEARGNNIYKAGFKRAVHPDSNLAQATQGIHNGLVVGPEYFSEGSDWGHLIKLFSPTSATTAHLKARSFFCFGRKYR